MIYLTFEQAIACYILFFVAIFLSAGIFSKVTKGFSADKELKLWQCAICTFVYSSMFKKNMTVCPQCGSYNKKEVDET